MNSEMKLAQILGQLPTTETEKVADHISTMTVDELEQFLIKEGMGKKTKKSEMTKLSQEQVDLADKWGREMAQKTKTSGKVLNTAKAVAGHVGRHKGLYGLAAGYEIGKHKSKTAGPLSAMAGQALSKGRSALGKGMVGVMRAGAGKSALVGAGLGAGAGAMRNPGVDPATGQQRSRLGNMVSGAAMGAGAGVVAKPLLKAVAQGKAGPLKMPGNPVSKATRGLMGQAGAEARMVPRAQRMGQAAVQGPAAGARVTGPAASPATQRNVELAGA